MRRNQSNGILATTRDGSPTEAGQAPAAGRRRGGGVQLITAFSKTYNRIAGKGTTHYVTFTTHTRSLEELIKTAHVQGCSKGGAGRQYGGVFEIQTDEGVWEASDGAKLTTKSATFKTWEQLENEERHLSNA